MPTTPFVRDNEQTDCSPLDRSQSSVVPRCRQIRAHETDRPLLLEGMSTKMDVKFRSLPRTPRIEDRPP